MGKHRSGKRSKKEAEKTKERPVPVERINSRDSTSSATGQGHGGKRRMSTGVFEEDMVGGGGGGGGGGGSGAPGRTTRSRTSGTVSLAPAEMLVTSRGGEHVYLKQDLAKKRAAERGVSPDEYSQLSSLSSVDDEDPDGLQPLRVIRFDQTVDVLVEARKLQKEAKYAKSVAKKNKKLTQEEIDEEMAKRPIQNRLPSHIGTKITKEHKNYELMFDMLLGIRHSVSMLAMKPQFGKLPLTAFQSVRDYRFPSEGGLRTPAHKMRDFKFRDYAPKVFRRIRHIFGVESSDYLMSLTGDYVLSELGSPGKSGSFFYYSYDMRFLLKTITPGECHFFQSILPQYYKHVRDNPDTLVSRFFGLHRVKPHRKSVRHFVVMANVFSNNLELEERFDLKGSTLGRSVPAEKRKKDSVLKDLDWVDMGRKLYLGPRDGQRLIEQMEADCRFLAACNIMDYSLLIGIHELRALGRRPDLAVIQMPKDVVAEEPAAGASSDDGSGDGSAAAVDEDTSSEDDDLPDIDEALKAEEGWREVKAAKKKRPRGETLTAEQREKESSLKKAHKEQKRKEKEAKVKAKARQKARAKAEKEAVKAQRRQRLATGTSSVGRASFAATSPVSPAARKSSSSVVADAHALAHTASGRGAMLGAELLTASEAASGARDRAHTMMQDKFKVSHFMQQNGGLQATNFRDEPLSTLYFIGIIDILQPYNMRKKTEHVFKSQVVHRGAKDDISAVNPRRYAERFEQFMRRFITLGEKGETESLEVVPRLKTVDELLAEEEEMADERSDERRRRARMDEEKQKAKKEKKGRRKENTIVEVDEDDDEEEEEKKKEKKEKKAKAKAKAAKAKGKGKKSSKK